MVLHAAWYDRYGFGQIGECLLILSPDQTVGLMVLADTWADTFADNREQGAYFALQGFLASIVPLLTMESRPSRLEAMELMCKGIQQAEQTWCLAREACLGGFEYVACPAFFTAVLVVDDTIYGVHSGANRVYVSGPERELYQATREHRFGNRFWPHRSNSKFLYDGVLGNTLRTGFDTFQLQGMWSTVVLCSIGAWTSLREDSPIPDWDEVWKRAQLHDDPQQLCDHLAEAALKHNHNLEGHCKILALQQRSESETIAAPLCYLPPLIKLPASIEPFYTQVIANRDNEKATTLFYKTFEGIAHYLEKQGRDQEASSYRQWLTDFSK